MQRRICCSATWSPAGRCRPPSRSVPPTGRCLPTVAPTREN